MPLYWREKTILFKEETTPGTDAVPTGAANAILATDVQLNPMEGQDTSRGLELPWMGAQGTVPTNVHAKLSFRVELKGSDAAGTPPVLGVLLKSCACAEVIVPSVSVTYNRVTSPLKSATIYLNIDGTLFKLLGARGAVQLQVNAQGIVYLAFEFWGLFVLPAAQAKPTVTLGTQLSAFPQVAAPANTPVFTIGGTTHRLRSLNLNFGNTVEPRFLVNAESIEITAISEVLETTIEAVALATLNPFSLARTGTTSAIVLTHGTGAGNVCTLTIPRAQCQRPGAPAQAQGIVEWPLSWVPLPDAGNDQFTLAFT